MRPVLYRVAASLDGYISGLKGEVDWIRSDPALDFAAIYDSVDTVLLGRRTYELTLQPGAPPWPAWWQIYLFSNTLSAKPKQAQITLVKGGAAATVAHLRAGTGKTIWLFGGGRLFATLLAAKQVDVVELAVMPILLGNGVPLLAHGAGPTPLSLVHAKPYSSGIVLLRYHVAGSAAG